MIQIESSALMADAKIIRELPLTYYQKLIYHDWVSRRRFTLSLTLYTSKMLPNLKEKVIHVVTAETVKIVYTPMGTWEKPDK